MKAEFGLKESDVFTICTILEQYPQVSYALIFGSRAKGNYKPGSDVDIALKGEKLNNQVLNNISFLLNEETNMPYKFDVLNYQSINETALIDHINRVGKLFYDKQANQGFSSNQTKKNI